jgi:hypothetical protein
MSNINQSCNFVPKGKTQNECYNTCLSDNTGDCLDYCNKTCGGCSDINQCQWLKTKSNNNLNSYLTEYNKLTDQIIAYQEKQKNLFNSANDSNTTPQIQLSKNINDLKIKRNILWNYLLNEYNYNTQLTEANYRVLRNSNKSIKSQKKIIEKNNESIDSITNLTNTKKRQIVINRNKFTKLQLQVKLLQIYVLFLLLGLSVIYLLKKGLVNKKAALIIYIVYVVILSILLYTYYAKKTEYKDDIKYHESNFGKPSKKEAGTDNLLAKMDDASKAKCLAISEVLQQQNFDPNSVNIGNINRYINDTSNCKKVSSNTDFKDIYIDES